MLCIKWVRIPGCGSERPQIKAESDYLNLINAFVLQHRAKTKESKYFRRMDSILMQIHSPQLSGEQFNVDLEQISRLKLNSVIAVMGLNKTE